MLWENIIQIFIKVIEITFISIKGVFYHQVQTPPHPEIIFSIIKSRLKYDDILTDKSIDNKQKYYNEKWSLFSF